MSTFNNKNVLTTGGARGIGLLMGTKALERGAAHLEIWDIDNEALNKAQADLTRQGFSVSVRLVDIRDPQQVQNAAELLSKEFGDVDILFNNAGVVAGKNFDRQSMEDIKKTMEVNSLGMMYVTRALLPAMVHSGGGHIINIASAAGLTANPGMTVYAGSKWAAVGWSESLKLELEQEGSQIKVLTVMPGYIDTGMFEGVSTPLLMPFLDPNAITNKIMHAVENNRARLSEPFMVKLTPFLKGILPRPIFDFVAGKIFKVYSSMSTFRGRR